MSKPNFSKSFWGYYEKNSKKKLDEESRQDQNQKKKNALELLKHNSKTLVDSENVLQTKSSKNRMDLRENAYKDIEIVEDDEINATPIKKRSSDGNANSAANTTIETPGPTKKFPFHGMENKALDRIRKQERKSVNKSMVSSPSIMMSKPKRPASLNETSFPSESPSEKKQKIETPSTSHDLKKPDNQEVENEIPKAINDQLGDHTSKNSSDARKTLIDNIRPESECSKINAQALRHLKETTVNFKTILNEMKKANEQIIEFRRALSWDTNE